MKPRQQLIDEGILNEHKVTSNHLIAQFYVEQLEKFNKLGMGGQTENGVIITPTLIKTTEKRFKKLRPFLRTRKITNKGE